MKPRWRVVVPVAILGVFGLVAVVYPQDVSDIGAMAKDLRTALKDLDGRLRHLEQLVKEMSKSSDKVVSSDTPAHPTPSTSKRFAAQEAYQKGRIEEDSQQYAKAIELFKKACELDPTNESAFLHRATANYKIGRVDEALYNVNRSIMIQPDNSRAIAFRATVYQTMKDYDRAVADLADAARRDSSNPDYLVTEGGIEEERGNFSRAADLYAAALTIKPDSAEIHLKRAAALKSTDNPQAALDECSQAIAFKPKDAGGYACRADYYVRQGQFPAAVSDLNQALAIRPDFPQAVSLLPVVRQLLEVNRAAANLAAAKQAAATQAANEASLNQAANQVAVVQPAPVPPAPAVPVQVQPMLASQWLRFSRRPSNRLRLHRRSPPHPLRRSLWSLPGFRNARAGAFNRAASGPVDLDRSAERHFLPSRRLNQRLGSGSSRSCWRWPADTWMREILDWPCSN